MCLVMNLIVATHEIITHIHLSNAFSECFFCLFGVFYPISQRVLFDGSKLTALHCDTILFVVNDFFFVFHDR